jgi:hypothetical protein
MAAKQWIAVDVRVHDNEPHVVEIDSPMRGIGAGLKRIEAPHQVFAISHAGRQVLVFAATSDADGLFAIVRDAVRSRGVASISAMVWDEDPRHTSAAPAQVLVGGPEPRQRGLGRDYDEILASLLSATDVVGDSPT